MCSAYVVRMIASRSRDVTATCLGAHVRHALSLVLYYTNKLETVNETNQFALTSLKSMTVSMAE